ncbi:MAG: tyrosine--tRNA ligase [Deltaproteobacteria bacterium]|nr:tyrosine--tRNA ligase [Deltaproteobacteria bacterium]
MGDARIQVEVERQLAVMREGAVDFYGESELARRLFTRIKEGRPLRVKLGADPSSPDLHLGHSVVLMKLRRFLELGHTPIFLIGDFTARIGDPSGRNKARPALTAEQVAQNARTYVDQVARLIDVSKIELRFNGEWMDAMKSTDFVRLCSQGTVARMLEREDFAKRHAGEVPIFVHEFLYPFVQAYDSVVLEADVELGGTDQTFNLLMGREIQKAYGQEPQAVITHPLLVGLDGKDKMSKSLGNSIGLLDDPANMYGKVMSLPDAAMATWTRLLSSGQWGELVDAMERFARGDGEPMVLKHDLAYCVVERLHGSTNADEARDHFRRVVQRKEQPKEIPLVELASGEKRLLEVLVDAGLAPSRAEARRLVEQGAVTLDGARAMDGGMMIVLGEHVLQVGKRRFARVRISG